MGCTAMNGGIGKDWKGIGKEITKALEDWKVRKKPTAFLLTYPNAKLTIYPKGHFKINPCRTFEEKVASCRTLDELNGFANRRRVLGIELPKWTDYQRQVILARKYELEKKKNG